MEKRPKKIINDSYPSESIDFWIEWFCNEILDISIRNELASAFLLHLADLKAFDITEKKIWVWKEHLEIAQWSDKLVLPIREFMDNLATTQRGWAVGFFLRGVPEFFQSPNLPPELNFKYKSIKERSLESQAISSDLSNLHIVRKVGRQLSPFLEMENRYLKQLTGKYTRKSQAQQLYRHILGKIRPKAEPVIWQQLSRRRHK